MSIMLPVAGGRCGSGVPIEPVLLHFIPRIPVALLFILLSADLATAGVQMNLSAPCEVNVCIPAGYGLRLSDDADIEAVFATVQPPEGFQYSGGAQVILGGLRSPSEPSAKGRSLFWDLGPAVRSCRHVVINEVDQNPPGQDKGNEWVELYNPSSHAVDIGRWWLTDSYYGKTVRIPAGTTISAGGYHVLNWTNGSLVNSRAMSIALRDDAGDEIDRTIEAEDEKDDDRCFARYPDGRDLGSDLDWRFQKASWEGPNGGGSPVLYAHEILDLEFPLIAGCDALGGQVLQAEVATEAASSAAHTPAIAIKKANLSISLLPDKFDVAKGDEVAWTVLLENTGKGTACRVEANATLGSGLRMVEIDSPGMGMSWCYATLEPGEHKAVRLRARAVSSEDLYSLVNVRWGYGPCQNISVVSRLGIRTALRKEPDHPRSQSIGDLVHYEICAEIVNASEDLWINDSLPKGLVYHRGSLTVLGPALLREISALKQDGSMQISWFFGDVKASESIKIDYDALVANDPENQDGLVLPRERATMSWNGGLETDWDEAGDVTLFEPDLVLEKSTSSAAADASGTVSYTLALFHSSQSHATAFDVDLRDLLPPGMNYSSGSGKVLQGPDTVFDPLHLSWNLGVLDQSWNSSHPAIIMYNATVAAQPGDRIVNSASLTWTSQAGVNHYERSGSGGVNDYLRRASVTLNAMRLSVKKTADPEPACVGEILSYTITYENEGREAANNVTIIDNLDPNVSFLSAEPSPSEGHETWQIPRLAPDGPHRISIKVKVSDLLENGTRLMNRFSIQSDEIGPVWSAISTDVLNGTRLEVEKTALQKAARRGEEITYVIRVCNPGGQPATNVSVMDVFDSSVEFISASPHPEGEGAWMIGTLNPGECAEITLVVRVPLDEVKFESRQSIKGDGFMRAYRDYTTELRPYAIINRAYVVSDQTRISAEARVNVLGEEGTSLHIREHGSGSYEDQEDLSFLSCNKSIRLGRSIGLHHHPTAFQLPGSARQEFSSRWSISAAARNGITLASLKESYTHSQDLKCSCKIDLDENGSELYTVASSQGLARLWASKNALDQKGQRKDLFCSEEVYAGDFEIQEGFSEGGRNVISDRSVSGEGYVASDHRIGGRQSQRSYESGAGNYSIVEEIRTSTNLMAKDIDVIRQGYSCRLTPRTILNITPSWMEGMWSSSKGRFLGEMYLNAANLKKRAIARGTRELESNATFLGRAEFRAISNESGSKQLDIDDGLLGSYRVKRRIVLAGISKYDRPHLTLLKEGRLSSSGQDSVVAAYLLTLTNDGNVSLGPLTLKEFFPRGSIYLNSTLRASLLLPDSAAWTFEDLPIGESVEVEVCLDVSGCPGDIINRARAEGEHGSIRVNAWNSSVIQRTWLGGCAPFSDLGSLAGPARVNCSCQEGNEAEYFDPVHPVGSDPDPLLNCPANGEKR